MDVFARLELRRAELQMVVDSLNVRAAKLTERDAYGDLAVAQNLEALRSRVLDAAEDAGFDVAYGQVMAPRETARSVHTGFPMSAEQRTVSALRATNVHARSVHCRRASMYVHPGDHSRRFGPERERPPVTCGHGVSMDVDCGACESTLRGFLPGDDVSGEGEQV